MIHKERRLLQGEILEEKGGDGLDPTNRKNVKTSRGVSSIISYLVSEAAKELQSPVSNAINDSYSLAEPDSVKNNKSIGSLPSEELRLQNSTRMDSLLFWQQALPSSMALALYRLASGNKENGEPVDVWGWRLVSFLRRHCEVICSLRDQNRLIINAASFSKTLHLNYIKQLTVVEDSSLTIGLRKYISEINGRREGRAGERLIKKQHRELIGPLRDALEILALRETQLVAAGFERLPYSNLELIAWTEWAELSGMVTRRADDTLSFRSSAQAL